MPAPRASYRHGNVRTAAIDAAWQQVTADGAAGLTLRRVAGDLGIAHRSLYNHFRDRDGLLLAVAARGYAALATALATERAATGFRHAYLVFALDHPAIYALMMAQGHDAIAAAPDLRQEVDRVIALALALFGSPDGDAASRRAVMREWMFLHGAAALHANGILERRSRAGFLAEVDRIREG